MSNHGLALLSISVISFALLVDEIMLSAIFHVLLGAGNTVAAIAETSTSNRSSRGMQPL